MNNITEFPNSKITPEMLVKNILENIDDIDTIYVVVKTKDDLFKVLHTQTSSRDLVMMNKVAELHINQIVKELLI